VRGQYRAFIDDFSRVRATTPAACFRQQTLLVHAWRKFPFLDPDLPASLLPERWPRDRAHALFADRHERWQPAARAYFAGMEAELGAAAVAA
jgi:phenylacetic acid degradation operon negative regulatory protein